MKTAIFLFNSSSVAYQPWLDSGDWNIVTVDFSDTDHSGTARKGPTIDPRVCALDMDLSLDGAVEYIYAIVDALEWAEPSFVLSFAPCSHLAVSGAAHYKKKREVNANFQTDAVALAKLVLQFDCPSIVENPVSVLASLWKKPAGYVHPWQFGDLLPADDVHPEFPEYYPPNDRYNKKTGLWCSKGAVLPVGTCTDDPKGEPNPCHVKLGGKSARTKYIRSMTPRGLAMGIYLANGVK